MPVIVSLAILSVYPLWMLHNSDHFDWSHWPFQVTGVMVLFWITLLMTNLNLSGWRYYVVLGLILPILCIVSYYVGFIIYGTSQGGSASLGQYLGGLVSMSFTGGFFAAEWLVVLIGVRLLIELGVWALRKYRMV
jgi:hypothetical protein